MITTNKLYRSPLTSTCVHRRRVFEIRHSGEDMSVFSSVPSNTRGDSPHVHVKATRSKHAAFYDPPLETFLGSLPSATHGMPEAAP